MAKATGSYESIIRGVSQQVPHDRLPGQHWLQDNLISDPVRGLARRHGSVMLHEQFRTASPVNDATRKDITKFKEQSFFVGGREYSFTYRTEAKEAGSIMPGIVVVDKGEGKLLSVEAAVADAVALDILDKGITSVTTVGQFVLFSAKGRPTTYHSGDMVDWTSQYAVARVRGGAYSRKYTVTVQRTDNSLVTFSYTTPASYYEGTLDTSDLNPTDPNYQKQVNDRVNAYNTAVNKHIANAGRAIQPENIAHEIAVAGHAAGVLTIDRAGSHLQFWGIKSVTVDDAGDGSLFVATSNEVESTNSLTARHVTGKTVRVTPRNTDFNGAGQSYYLTARSASPGLEGWQDVIWEEGPGIAVTPEFVFMMGYIRDGVLYVASTAALLESITGLAEVPTFSRSTAGDSDSSPLPGFLGKQIDHLRTFQDRLMIVSGATVFLSKSGDYFNFFRKSALTLADDDPIEVFAEGSEGDIVTASVQLDRTLLLFGRLNQYALGSREAITPRNAYVSVQSSHEDSTEAPPVAAGNLIFFTQRRSNRLTVQQMQTGAYADSFDSFDITTQLDGYLSGTPKQVVAMTSPSMLFLRSEELTNGVYVFSYLDAAGAERRMFDSWSRWTWDPSLGPLLSLTSHESSLLTITLREATDGTYLVLDQFVRESRLSEAAYLDSRRPADRTTGTILPGWPGEANSAVAYHEDAGAYARLGRPLAEASILFNSIPVPSSLASMGTYFTSAVEPTAPYIRDEKDRAIMDGRLTVSKLVVTVSDTSAMIATVRANGGTPKEVTNWVYRPVGEWILNSQQVAGTASITVPIMKEARDYRLQLKSRNWLPFTISSIEWQGQFFTSRRS